MNTARIMKSLEAMTADAHEAHQSAVLASDADHDPKTCTKCRELAEADAILTAHDPGDRKSWIDTNSVPDTWPETHYPECNATRPLGTRNARTGEASCACMQCGHRWKQTIFPVGA